MLPAVTALDLIIRAARALRPGQPIREVRDLAVLKGIRLPHYDGPTSEELTGRAAAGVGDRFLVSAESQASAPDVLHVQIVGRTDAGLPLRHYAAKVVLASHVEQPRGEETKPAGLASELIGGTLAVTRDTIYDGLVLFHGPLFHAIEAIEGESERGIRGTLVGRDRLGWPTDAAAPTDGALLDGALQLAVYRTKHTHHGASLPTSIARFVQGPASRTSGPVSCTVVARGTGPEKARFDLELVDERNALVARLEGLEVFVLPGSRDELARTAAPAEAE